MVSSSRLALSWVLILLSLTSLSGGCGSPEPAHPDGGDQDGDEPPDGDSDSDSDEDSDSDSDSDSDADSDSDEGTGQMTGSELYS
jgi:hypothetical protein